MSTVGGNSPQLLVNEMAAAIATGEADVVVIGGAESMHTRWRARREPRVHLEWPADDGTPCADVIGDPRPGDERHRAGALGRRADARLPAVRDRVARRGGPIGRRAPGARSARCGRASRRSPPTIRTRGRASRTRPTRSRSRAPDNRMVVFPYTKRMCANIDVDQGAALLLCSYEAAQRRGHRRRSDRVPARGRRRARPLVRHRTRRARGGTGDRYRGRARRSARRASGIDDVARFDLYSCFPVRGGDGDARARACRGRARRRRVRSPSPAGSASPAGR